MNYRNNYSNTNFKQNDQEYDLDKRLEHVFDDMKGRDDRRDKHAQKKMKDKDYRRKYGDDYDD